MTARFHAFRLKVTCFVTLPPAPARVTHRETRYPTTEEHLVPTYTGWANFDSGCADAKYFRRIHGSLQALCPPPPLPASAGPWTRHCRQLYYTNWQ